MQSNEFIAQEVTSAEPIELDPALWAEVVGGTPKNTWSTILGLVLSEESLGGASA